MMWNWCTLEKIISSKTLLKLQSTGKGFECEYILLQIVATLWYYYLTVGSIINLILLYIIMFLNLLTFSSLITGNLSVKFNKEYCFVGNNWMYKAKKKQLAYIIILSWCLILFTQKMRVLFYLETRIINGQKPLM